MNKFVTNREKTAVGHVPRPAAPADWLKISRTCCLDFPMYRLEAAFGREHRGRKGQRAEARDALRTVSSPTLEVAGAGRRNEQHRNTNQGFCEIPNQRKE